MTDKDKKVTEAVELTAEEEVKLSHIDDERFQPSYEIAKEYKTRAIVVKIITYTFLTLFAFFMLLPFWFMISVSVKTPLEYQREVSTGLRLFTANPSFVNFRIVLGMDLKDPLKEMNEALLNIVETSQERSFIPYFLNTIIVAVVSTVFTIVTTVLASFAFARLEFKGKNFLFAILLATMMIPGEMMLITNIQTAKWLGWENTYRALIFVHGVSVFYIFYLRQTFQQIPNELFLAAKVDGYGEFSYLWRVMIPIGMPTIVTIIILNVMGSWNAFIWPTLIAQGYNPTIQKLFKKLFKYEYNHTMRLVSNGLMSTFTGQFASYDTVKIAASMIVTAPLLLVFVFFRKYIMSGVSRSGIKG